MCIRLTLIAVLTVVIAYCHAAGVSEPQVQNERLKLSFSSDSGALVRITDLQTQADLLSPILSEKPLWQIDFATSPTTRLLPADAGEFVFDVQEDTLRLEWRGFSHPDAAGQSVRAQVRLPANSRDSFWSISIDGLSSTPLQAVHFPCIPPLNTPDELQVTVPLWMGQLCNNPAELVNRPAGKARREEWHYPGHLSMQCMAATRAEAPGIYFASNDASAYHKTFAMMGDGRGGVLLEQTHFPEHPTTATWSLPYEAVVGAIDGDWFSAAERYRSWATAQEWTRNSRLRTGKTAKWASECDLWIWNRGVSTGVIDPAIALTRHVGTPVGVFWHWWHQCAYDVGFPDYFPPREGEASFTSALSKAHKAGVHVITYMNQRLWGMTTDSWKSAGAERFAVKSRDGLVKPEVYNVFTSAPCASMCMGTEFWRDTYADLTQEARKLGVDGIYMDQACTSLSCYDPTHLHSSGGGRYWMEGFRHMVSDIRSRGNDARSPVVLAGEGVGEAWLPHLDLMLSLEVSRERYMGTGRWEVIPFFHAVYHQDALIYGNYASLVSPPYDEKWPKEFRPDTPLSLLDDRYNHQFALEQARSFVWGQQLTIANFLPDQLVSRAAQVDFVARLSRLRTAARQYLRDGTMLAPPVVNVSETTIPISRVSIYAGRTPNALRHFEKSIQPVLAAAWRSPQGKAALAIANTAGESSSFTIIPRVHEWGLSEATTATIQDTSGTRVLEGWQAPGGPLQLTLSPLGACIVEFDSKK